MLSCFRFWSWWMPVRIPAVVILAMGLPCLAGAEAGPVPAVTVSMPQGGCTLTVWVDQRASMHFGAMPRRVRVKPGAFRFEALLASLRERAYSPDAAMAPGEPGTVAFPGAATLWFIDDTAFIGGLLRQAWDLRMPPNRPGEQEDYRWVADACGFDEPAVKARPD